MTFNYLLFSLFLSLTSMGSCHEGWGKPEPGRGDFIDAKLTSGGRIGVFTFNRGFKLPSEYQRSPFSPPPKELADGLVIGRTYIGTYDVETGSIKILWMKENTKWILGGYKLFIASLEGETALIREFGQTRPASVRVPDGYYLLDIKTARLSPLSLDAELAQRNSKVQHAYVVDPDGTLLIETGPPDAPVDTNPTSLPGLWLRYPSGEYVLVDTEADFYPNYSGDGKIYYSMAGSYDGMKVYDLTKRTSQKVDHPKIGDPILAERKHAESSLSADALGHLVFSRRIDGQRDWEAKTLDVNTDILK